MYADRERLLENQKPELLLLFSFVVVILFELYFLV